ncbi:hypothetical protein HanXRQr2_Chr13g0615251 [Helianthus annuus]|uniref:Uncharacterized protein n=1 Tax=Helianthus annuus TaxID=4232 RepID=A0A251SYA3_HELAN|nr:hypothetical protein HanXRQr2_Chr13g0615251 [Helianthus annuus]
MEFTSGLHAAVAGSDYHHRNYFRRNRNDVGEEYYYSYHRVRRTCNTRNYSFHHQQRCIPSKYGWKPEILKKGVMEEGPTIVCRPIISHIPCINTRDYYWYLD